MWTSKIEYFFPLGPLFRINETWVIGNVSANSSSNINTSIISSNGIINRNSIKSSSIISNSNIDSSSIRGE